MKIIDSKYKKILISENCNYIFDKTDGTMITWGKTKDDDPEFSPYGPFIADIEITTICKGIPNKDGVKTPCPFCYKSNSPKGINMSFDTFKKIIDKVGIQLTQIAFGGDSEAISNPDMFKMMEYARSKGIIPNITVANVNDETASKLAKLVGACAVSRYSNKDICYDTVKRLELAGVKQINLHQLVCEEKYDEVMETLNDMKTDDRLKSVRAVVLLSLKQKGRGEKFTPLSLDKFKKIVEFALENKIGIGFDSCSANKFLKVVKDHPDYKNFETLAEPCESGVFSSYWNAEGYYYSCSFVEELEPGIHIDTVKNFLTDVWNSEYNIEWRKRLKNSCRSCPIFKV
jgi:radical SAM protein with 4Fe4S-binding SPASM domain